MEQSTESELVALARKGDKHAFGQLIEHYTQMVKRITIGKIANEEIARELVDEARKALADVLQKQTRVAVSFRKDPETMNQLSEEYSKMIEFLTGKQ